jgi:hypothetical protein
VGGHSRRVERLILGAGTAAAGPFRPGQPPPRLSEIPTPPAPPALPSTAPPQPFLPLPQYLVLPGSMAPCAGPGTFPAAWISGVTAAPAGSPDLLIAYDEYCVSQYGATLTPEGFGLVSYYPAGNLLGPLSPVFRGAPGGALPPQQVLGSPVASGRFLYLFGFCRAAPPPGGCGHGSVFGARTPAQPRYWGDPLTYRYWTGSGWSPDPNTAGTLIPGIRPLGVSAGDYRAAGHGLVMIVQTSLSGGFQVWQAAAPAGPWHRILTSRVPCGHAPQGRLPYLCRALIGHPELSTRRRLFVSYFSPARHHLEIAAFAW